MRVRRSVQFLIALAVGMAISEEAAKAGVFTNQADIKVENAATSDGAIIFRFSPRGGRTEEITVPVRDGWGEGRIAREIQATLNGKIGSNYRVHWNGARKVTITKRGGKKRFFLSRRGITANGVTIRIDYD